MGKEVAWVSYTNGGHGMPTSTIEEVRDYHRRIVQWYDDHLKGDLKKKAEEAKAESKPDAKDSKPEAKEAKEGKEAKPAETVVVTITKDMLLVQGEKIASMDQIRDPNAALIEPLREYLSRPLTTKSGAAQQAALAHREITVLADRGLPYEVIRKVMTTCTAAAYDKLSLAVLETGGNAPAGG